MKRLKCNFTTPEQSKRLLELGVPADSADCYWFDEKEIFFLQDKLYSDEAKDGELVRAIDYIPCWSVGRLLEIYVIVRGLDTSYLPIERGEDMVKYLIRLYEEKAKDMDFSKLEE